MIVLTWRDFIYWNTKMKSSMCFSIVNNMDLFMKPHALRPLSKMKLLNEKINIFLKLLGHYYLARTCLADISLMWLPQQCISSIECPQSIKLEDPVSSAFDLCLIVFNVDDPPMNLWMCRLCQPPWEPTH